MAIRTDSGVKLTWKDFARFPDDGRRHEILDGKHVVSPAPIVYHQLLSARILLQLGRQIPEAGLGEVLSAPIGVELLLFDVAQPDLLVLLTKSLRLVQRAKIKGAPDLLVEILSPSTRGRDQGRKKERYQAAGVPEYWIVDGDAHVVEQLVLEGQEYELLGRHTEEIVFRGLPSVRVDLTRVW